EGRGPHRDALRASERGRAGRRLGAVRCAGAARRRPRRQESLGRRQRQRAGILQEARLRRKAAQQRHRQWRGARPHHQAEDAGEQGTSMSRAEMSRERLYLFDTTLRDGAQTNGVDFTLADKQVIAGMLDDLGIDYVEGGYPGANPTDTEFFATKPKLKNARF